MIERIRSLGETANAAPTDTDDEAEPSDHDEIIGLARKIERMAKSLQKVEASYRGIVEDQVDLICRYKPDGRLTFVNGSFARAFGKKRAELVGEPIPFLDAGHISSHEIRTPINGISGFADMLAGTKLNDEQREHVNMIRRSGQSLAKLINDILDLSKIEAGKIENAPFAMHKTLSDVCAFFTQEARSRGVSLNCDIADDVPAIVLGDETRLRQILTNLLGNAVKFTERGRIDVTLSCSKSLQSVNGLHTLRLFFTITDTGVGIDPDKIDKLFQPFSQVDSSLLRRRNGTGLGLAISKRLCELMGGSISVESRKGEGSIFRFTLQMEYQRGDTTPPVAVPS
jgi:signal transduction histidine kinase